MFENNLNSNVDRVGSNWTVSSFTGASPEAFGLSIIERETPC